MNNKNNTTHVSGKGVGFGGLLTLVFIVLKLTHVISWSWVWVLSPLWISFLLTILVLIAIFAFVGKILK